jgi:hypothetical protein
MNFIIFLPALLILFVYYVIVIQGDGEEDDKPTFTVEEYQSVIPSPPEHNEVIGMAFDPIAGPLGNSNRRHAVLLKNAPFIEWV